MKFIILLSLLLLLSVNTYDRTAARQYAKKYWNSLNHKCSSSYSSCTPYSYWGGEHCGYKSQGGDCANFVSQCLIAGGHPKLVGGVCRGYPCGKEEIGAARLGNCLTGTFGWKRTCGYHLAPPSDIQVGDVLIYHKGSCSDSQAHATIIVEAGSNPKIACHSNMHYGKSYTYLANEKPYYEWLRFPGSSPSPKPDPKPDPKPEPKPDPQPTPVAGEKLVKITASSGVKRRKSPSLNGNVAGGYTKGTIVHVVAKSGDWYKDDAGLYFTADSRWVTDLVGTVTASALNVRQSANTSSKILTTISKGSKVRCIKKSGTWYYAKTGNGVTGWMSGNYLSF